MANTITEGGLVRADSQPAQVADGAAAQGRAAALAREETQRVASIEAGALDRVAQVQRRQLDATARALSEPGGPRTDARASDSALVAAMDSAETVSPSMGRAAALRIRDTIARGFRAEREAVDLRRRPAVDDEIPASLRTRYVVTSQKAGPLNEVETQFTFRSGSRGGQTAFVDRGTQLATELNDRETARAMVELASAKGWTQLTLAGSEEFKRAAWLEAGVRGLQASGYEAREPDKQRLAELQAERHTEARSLANSMAVDDRRLSRQEAASGDVPREGMEALRARLLHVVGDNPVLSSEEERALRAAHEQGDSASSRQVHTKAAERIGNDLKTIRSMDERELRELARLHDGAGGVDTEKRVRAALDGSASRPEARREEQLREPTPGPRPVTHHDGDRVSNRQAETLSNLRGLLSAKRYSAEFVEATMAEVERRMESQRVHVGAVVEHGPARFRFEADNDPSYYVRLRTARGDEVVWGKQLADAMREGGIKLGDQVALTNTGFKAVTVTEQARDDGGRQILHPKDTRLNAWVAQPIEQLTARETRELMQRAEKTVPGLRIYDPQAERMRVERAPVATVDTRIDVDRGRPERNVER